MTCCLKMQLVFEIAALRVLRAQKFSPGRQIVEDRAHFDLCPRRLAAVADRFDLAASDDDLRTRDRVGFAGRQPKTRDARDAGERLAAKSQGRDCRQIGGCPDFARGVPLEGKQRIVAIHSGAVIDDTNERNTAAPDADLDLARAGVDAVLDQFFHNRRRPLDHFARRDLAGENFRQQANATHDVFNFKEAICDCEGKR